jgi:hypothetical protein
MQPFSPIPGDQGGSGAGVINVTDVVLQQQSTQAEVTRRAFLPAQLA